jgi:hypothetical protein
VRIGILSDIHEHVEHLRAALKDLAEQSVDQVLVLGDVRAHGERLADTVALLAQAKAVGVWGNHDLPVCHSAEAVDCDEPTHHFMRSLKPRIEYGDVFFSHVEPWLDPHDPLQIWNFGGPPGTALDVFKSFAATNHRIIVVGHFHRWLAWDERGAVGWQDGEPLCLPHQGRYLVSVGALWDGAYGVLDTSAEVLLPLKTAVHSAQTSQSGGGQGRDRPRIACAV